MIDLRSISVSCYKKSSRAERLSIQSSRRFVGADVMNEADRRVETFIGRLLRFSRVGSHNNQEGAWQLN